MTPLRDNNNRPVTGRLSAMGLIVTIGIVFGDIGTSPLYVMKTIVGANPGGGADYITGAVSAIIWTLTLQTTVKYVLIALRADNKGEGGILALYALLKRHPRRWLYAVAATGAATLIADGIITPAVTVTSAVEGLGAISPEIEVLPIVIVIILAVFVVQPFGTGAIGRCFGPFMLVWFLMLGVTGIAAMVQYPAIVKAFNPVYAVRLVTGSPEWFLILGAVFLCTTGAEALYSDLGHCGRRNITVSWMLVKTMLILNYLGQGAWIIAQTSPIGSEVNPFYAAMPRWLMVPAIVIATGAAVIASQALISGSFTIFSEAMNLGFWPRMRIKYPSTVKGQLFIPAVNGCMCAGCLATVLLFRNSSHMEAAYGLAITVTMLMTTLMITFYLRLRGIPRWLAGGFLIVFATIEGGFLVANLHKFTHGGWFTLLIAGVACGVMLVWHNAGRIRDKFVEYRRIADYLPVINDMKNDREIPKYTSNLVYISQSPDPQLVESKLVYSIINKRPKRADHYWLIRIDYLDDPDTLEYTFDQLIKGTMFGVTLRLGFRVQPRVSLYLRQIVEDCVAAGHLDLRSTYPSLRRHDIAGDFHFVMIHRVFSLSSNCNRTDSTIMHMSEAIRHIGISDTKALGLDTSNVTVENVPLIINTHTPRRITPAAT